MQIYKFNLTKKLVHKIIRIKENMDATEKFDEFLKSKDENYLLSLKAYFCERFQLPINEKGELTGKKLDTKQIEELFTSDFITASFAEIPGGLTDFLTLVDEFIDPISELILYFLSENIVNQLDSSIFTELESELDIGSDKALLTLVDSVLNKISNGELSWSNQVQQTSDKFLVAINGNVLKLLMQATLSIHLKLSGSAKMQIQHALKIIMNKLTPYNIQHAAVGQLAVKNKAKLAGKKGSEKRWVLKNKVKEEAFKLRDEMIKTGKFRSDFQASKSLASALCLFAKDIGDPFTESFSAQARIYKWFRAEK